MKNSDEISITSSMVFDTYEKKLSPLKLHKSLWIQ